MISFRHVKCLPIVLLREILRIHKYFSQDSGRVPRVYTRSYRMSNQRSTLPALIIRTILLVLLTRNFNYSRLFWCVIITMTLVSNCVFLSTILVNILSLFVSRNLRSEFLNQSSTSQSLTIKKQNKQKSSHSIRNPTQKYF